jgi:hypothetical protein
MPIINRDVKEPAPSVYYGYLTRKIGGDNLLKVPLFKGDLGGSLSFKCLDYDLSNIL